MLKVADKQNCCGCGACEQVCGVGALKMKADGMGFMYPDIDLARCTDCGACERICKFKGEEIERASVPLKGYALKHKDRSEITRSQSGGAFAALSDHVLSEGGVVYGAGYGDGLYVRHTRAVTPEERDAFRGSKYVQSDMGTVYGMMRRDIKAGKKVLFTGTPCQNAAVRSLFGNECDERIILVDLVCHGVASPGIWKDYLAYLEKRHGGKVVDAKFRDKKFGWHAHRESYSFADGAVVYPRFLVYIPLFMRPSCGGCKYSCMNRVSDITIGDYWGVEERMPGFETENLGCSLALCNTEKGLRLFEDIKQSVEWREMESIRHALQPNLEKGTRLPANHAEFSRFYELHGFRKSMVRYGFMGWKVNVRRLLRRLKRRIISGRLRL